MAIIAAAIWTDANGVRPALCDDPPDGSPGEGNRAFKRKDDASNRRSVASLIWLSRLRSSMAKSRAALPVLSHNFGIIACDMDEVQ